VSDQSAVGSSASGMAKTMREDRLGVLPKVDGRWFRIVPVAFLMYTIAYVDRTNISLCLPAMQRDLHMNAVEGGNVAGIFFWGYLWLQIPGGYLARHWSAKRVVSVLLVAWGFSAVAMGFVSTRHQAVVVRLLLGLAEGGVFPATLVLLSNWFGEVEHARANGYWMLCQPFAIVLSSPLSGFILGRWGWRTVFIVEGAFPFAWLIVWELFVADGPAAASWLGEEERRALLLLIRPSTPRAETGQRLNWSALIGSRQVWIMAAIGLLQAAGGYGFMFWFPASVLRIENVSPASLGIIFAIPYVLAGAALVLNARHSDASGERRLHVLVPLVLSGLSLMAAAVAGRISFFWYLFCLSLAGAALYSALGPFWSVPSETLPPEIHGPAVGLINAVTNLGGYFGPVMVGALAAPAGTFASGFGALSVCLVAGGTLSLALRHQHPQGAGQTSSIPAADVGRKTL
jgi:MFS family permease